MINAVFPQEADGDDVLERRHVDNVEPKGRPSNDARTAAVAPSLPPCEHGRMRKMEMLLLGRRSLTSAGSQHH